jgi:hypothetical protein
MYKAGNEGEKKTQMQFKYDFVFVSVSVFCCECINVRATSPMHRPLVHTAVSSVC